MKTIDLIDGELVDTRNGYSWRDVWVEIDDEGMIFYERIYGVGDYAYWWKRENGGYEVISDEDEIKYLKTLIKD